MQKTIVYGTTRYDNLKIPKWIQKKTMAGHWGYPPALFGRTKKVIEYEFEFTESCKYVHDPKENYQKSWNKLCGVQLKWSDPHIVTMMAGWRYNPEKDLFEITPYQHDKKIYPNVIRNAKIWEKEHLWSFKVGERFIIKIEVFENHFGFTMNDEYLLFEKTRTLTSFWIILNWFGGRLPTKNDLEILYNRIQ